MILEREMSIQVNPVVWCGKLWRVGTFNRCKMVGSWSSNVSIEINKAVMYIVGIIASPHNSQWNEMNTRQEIQQIKKSE